MVNAVVIDHNVEGVSGHQKIKIYTNDDGFSIHALRDIISERLGLEREGYNVVIDGKLQLNSLLCLV